MSNDIFEDRRKSLEEQFFAKENERLRQKLKTTFDQKETRESLQAVSGITDENVLDAMLALNVNHQSLAAFALLPLVEVAWADGSVSEAERLALLEAADKDGIVPGSPARDLLDECLSRPPRAEARTAWIAYASELNRKLNPGERTKVRDELLRRARAVANASGGVLGFGKVSANEEAVLEAIKKAFE